MESVLYNNLFTNVHVLDTDTKARAQIKSIRVTVQCFLLALCGCSQCVFANVVVGNNNNKHSSYFGGVFGGDDCIASRTVYDSHSNMSNPSESPCVTDLLVCCKTASTVLVLKAMVQGISCLAEI